MTINPKIITINEPEGGSYQQAELRQTMDLLTQFEVSYPDEVDYWLIDPRGAIDIGAVRKGKALFIAEVKKHEGDRITLRLKWGEVKALAFAGIPLIGFTMAHSIKVKGKVSFGVPVTAWVTPDMILSAFTLEELREKPVEKRLTLNPFTGKLAGRVMTPKPEIVFQGSEEIELLRRKLNEK